MLQYVWQSSDWPRFRWDAAPLLEPLARCRRRQGAFLAGVASLGFCPEDAQAAQVEVLIEEAVQTAAIEGQTLDRESVRSSVALRLGLPQAGMRAADRVSDGLVRVLLDATQNHDQPLTGARIKGWNAALFPTGYSGLYRVRAGQWRATPVQVVSGPVGVLPEGTSLGFKVKFEKPSFVLLLNISPGGNVNVLYPYTENELKQHPADKELRVPPSKVTGPFGVETLAVYAFDRKPDGIERFKGLEDLSATDSRFEELARLLESSKESFASHWLQVKTSPKEDIIGRQ